MKYPVKRVPLTAPVSHKFQLHRKVRRGLHVSMYGKSNNNHNNNYNNNSSEEIMLLCVKILIENTCGKKCIGLTEEDATIVYKNIICNENFRKTVMHYVNNLQFYFFPKLGVNNLNDYIAVIYKHNNDNFATTYFSVLA